MGLFDLPRRRVFPHMGLRHGSLFAGVGMIDYGLGLAGFEHAWQVEIDPFCRGVLANHWPGVDRYEDVRDCGVGGNYPHQLAPVDLVSGGFPCHDISVGGVGPRRRAGAIDGIGTPEEPSSRSGLWYQFARIVGELRPRYVLIENVDRLFHTQDISRVVSDMEAASYACWPLVLGAGVFGAPHERKRAWILCQRHDPDGDQHPALGGEVGPGELSPVARRALEETRQHWDDWKRELVSGDADAGRAPGQSQAAAYGKGRRDLHGDAEWVDAVRCGGNSVVWVIPLMLGTYVRELERARAGG